MDYLKSIVERGRKKSIMDEKNLLFGSDAVESTKKD